jgi:hypothetical protein
MQRKTKYNYKPGPPQAFGHEELLEQLIRESIQRAPLYEGLIYSYPPSAVFPGLKQIGFSDVWYNKYKNLFVIGFILGDDNKSRYEKLNRFMDNVCGWTHSATMANKIRVDKRLDFLLINDGFAELQYEAKFDIEMYGLPEKIYHLTTTNKVEKILRMGLTPRNSITPFNYNNRIYFSLNSNTLLSLAKEKVELNVKKTKEPTNFTILEITPTYTQLGMRFFKDPNFVNGVYTLENIPPEAINPIYSIVVSQDGTVTQNPI